MNIVIEITQSSRTPRLVTLSRYVLAKSSSGHYVSFIMRECSKAYVLTFLIPVALLTYRLQPELHRSRFFFFFFFLFTFISRFNRAYTPLKSASRNGILTEGLLADKNYANTALYDSACSQSFRKYFNRVVYFIWFPETVAATDRALISLWSS